MLCSDLVLLSWRDAAGARRSEVCILENLSPSALDLFTGVAIEPGCRIELLLNTETLKGSVQACRFRENGYVVGVDLDPDSSWGHGVEHGNAPEHLLDLALLRFE